MSDEDKSSVSQINIGWRITFKDDKTPYLVRAKNERYLICTKFSESLSTSVYFIIDLKNNTRTEEAIPLNFHLIVSEQCAAALSKLKDEDLKLSTIPLNIANVKSPLWG